MGRRICVRESSITGFYECRSFYNQVHFDIYIHVLICPFAYFSQSITAGRYQKKKKKKFAVKEGLAQNLAWR
jgi:hypothetical protein